MNIDSTTRVALREAIVGASELQSYLRAVASCTANSSAPLAEDATLIRHRLGVVNDTVAALLAHLDRAGPQ